MVKCPNCMYGVSDSAKTCPNCGKPIKKKQSIKRALLVGLGILVVFVMFSNKNGTSSSSRSSQPTNTQTNSSTNASAESNWWSGGSLHGATGYEWRNATYANKLATCGDILSYMWQEDMLSSRLSRNIGEMADLRVYADSLVIALDIVFERVPGNDETDSFVASQKVSEMAVFNLSMTDWLR